MSFEVHNMDMKTGDTLKIKGKIADDADKFMVNLGSSEGHIAMHLNPRFHDDIDGAVIVCNSMCNHCWDSEHRDSNFPFSKGEEVKVCITFKGDNFEIKLPNGHMIEFPNRLSLDKVTYMSVQGDFKMVSFKYC
ncbi:galectin-2-like isoform X2 [Heptranchias perlo]|uniref:galectin-2-like isoform X1 n=1 Tax=Heptranchias perlo TaxID=212740 RepID=UPI00355A7B7C